MKPFHRQRRIESAAALPEGSTAAPPAGDFGVAPVEGAPDPDPAGQPVARWSENEATLERDHALPCPHRELLLAVQRGEPEALGAFFDLYFDRIYALAYRLLGQRAQAEDVTQEVCYRVQRAAASIDPDRDPRPWILTATTNACRSHWRSAAHRMERATASLTGPDGLGRDPVDPAPGPAEQLLARERERAVMRALDEIPPASREVVILRDYQGLDHREIASILRISHEAARKRYSRALQELGERLKGLRG